MRAVICGAGLDGLVLALQLGRGGCDVLIIRDPLQDTSVPFLVELRGESLHAFEQLGVLGEIRDSAERLSRMRWFDPRGHAIASAALEECTQGGSNDCLRVQRERIEAILLDRLPASVRVAAPCVVTRVAPDSEGVNLELEDGGALRADLLLAADGGHSRIRELVFGDEGLWKRPLGYHSASFVFEDDAIRHDLPDEVAILSAPGRRVALWPLRQGRVGATFTFRTASVVKPKTPATWLKFVFGDMGWCIPSVLDHAQRAARLYYDRATQIKTSIWHRGRVALLGDACHTYSVLPGQGCSEAIAAAFWLGNELLKPGSFDVALLNYESHLIRAVAARRQNSRRMTLWHIPDSRGELVLRNGLLRLASLPGMRRFISPLTMAG